VSENRLCGYGARPRRTTPSSVNVAAREAELAMAEYESEKEVRRGREFRELLARDAAGTRAFIEKVSAGPTKGLQKRAAKILQPNR
jgi:hypothetical protein